MKSSFIKAIGQIKQTVLRATNRTIDIAIAVKYIDRFVG
jgi:hypothetical protein